MAMDYNAIAAGALRVLAGAGRGMTIFVPGVAAYDPVTAAATAALTEYDCAGVLLPPAALKGSGFTFGPDILVRAAALAYVAASGLAVTPAPGCTLAIGAETWRVIGSDTLAPAGTAVLHALALARA